MIELGTCNSTLVLEVASTKLYIVSLNLIIVDARSTHKNVF